MNETNPIPLKLLHLISILIAFIENHSQNKTDQSERYPYQCGILESVWHNKPTHICSYSIAKIEGHLDTCSPKHLATRRDTYDQ